MEAQATNDRKPSGFKWTLKAQKAAILLAQGYTQPEAGGHEDVKVSDRTIRRWQSNPEFAKEVDRLTYLVGLAARVERLRLSMRIARQLSQKSKPTNKDLLEWMKFIQSETDGAKLDLSTLFGDDAPVSADSDADTENTQTEGGEANSEAG